MSLLDAVRLGRCLDDGQWRRLRPADLLETDSATGDSALHLAAALGRADAVWQLCTAGGSPIVTNAAGLRPIDVASTPLILQILTNAKTGQSYNYLTHL